MARTFTRTAADRGLAQIQHVTPVRQAAARGPVAAVYAQVERDFGMLAPPVGLHSPAPGPLAASWLILRETLVASGLLGRAAKEAVAAAVSLGNACPYCVDVHSATLHGLVAGRDAVALASGGVDAIADPDLRDIAAWARLSGQRASVARLRSPVPAGQRSELLGVAVTFHYFNRMVHVFLPDSPIPPQVPTAARGGFWRLLGRFMWRAARSAHEPGASLSLLPPAELPSDLSWASGSPHIAGAFARAAAVIEAAGARSVPRPVRDLVHARLARWHGQPVGLSRAWVDDAVVRLAPADRPAGTLALLTAIAPYQIDRSVIDAFRAGVVQAQCDIPLIGSAERHIDQARVPDDRTLVELTSWAALTAARRIGTWLASPRAAEPPAA